MTDEATRPQLQRIIAGLRDGVMLIEPDGAMAYANAAALAMHGAADLGELGRTVDEFLAAYVLVRGRDRSAGAREGHPILRAVEGAARGEAVEDEVVHLARRGDAERDWTHRVRSLPLLDAAGRLDCVVVVITDVSGQVEAEARFERTFAANPAPAAICRLRDGRFVKVNRGFLDLTGYRQEEVLGRSLHEVDVLRGAERRDLALERLRAGRTVPQMEARLETPRDRDRLVIVAGEPLEVADEDCMLFTFADLEPRRRAEAALRQSEERFVKCFRLAPVPMALLSAGGRRLLEANRAFEAATGHAPENVAPENAAPGDATGRGAGELRLWADPEARRAFEEALARSGRVAGLEARLRTRDGAPLDCLLAADMATVGGEPMILCALQDITARRRSEAELVAAIEAVMADASWFAQGVVERLAVLRRPAPPGGAPEEPVAGLADLTAREREVLALVCEGAADEGIGARLGISRHTVRNHVAALYRKLGVNRRPALIVWARERGLPGRDLARDLERVGSRPRRGRNVVQRDQVD